MSEKKKTTAPKSAEEKEQKNRIPENVSGAEKLNELIERCLLYTSDAADE